MQYIIKLYYSVKMCAWWMEYAGNFFDTELAEFEEESCPYLSNLTRFHRCSVTYQGGTRSPEIGRFVKHNKSSELGVVGKKGSISYHTSCQRVQRGFREESDFTLTWACWCKQNWDSTWRLTYCRHFSVFSNGRSDCGNLPSDDRVLFFLLDEFWLLQ